MKKEEYITPSGAKVIVIDNRTEESRKRMEQAVISFMKKVVRA